jgi:CheY-like chemotaxis protein
MNGDQKLILLVEDNPADVALMLRAFKQNRICNEVKVAHNGVEAFDYLFATDSQTGKHLHELPELVLLDLKLPKIDGIEVLRRIRSDERTKLLPVVMITTSAEERDVLASYQLGVNSFVQKPVDFNQFSEAVRQLGIYWLLLNINPPVLHPS